VDPRWSEPIPRQNYRTEATISLTNDEVNDVDPELTMSDELHRKLYSNLGQEMVRYDSDDSAVNIKKKRKKRGHAKNKEDVSSKSTAVSREKKKLTQFGGTDLDLQEVKVSVNAADDKMDIDCPEPPPPDYFEVMKVSRSHSVMTVRHDAANASHNAPVIPRIHPVLTHQTEREYDFQNLRQYYEALGRRERSLTLPKQTLAAPVEGTRLKRALSASDVHEIANPSVIFKPNVKSELNALHLEKEGATKHAKKKHKHKHRRHHRSAEQLDDVTSAHEKVEPDVAMLDETLRRDSETVAVALTVVIKSINVEEDVIKPDETSSTYSRNVAADGIIGAESFKTMEDGTQFVNDQHARVEEVSKDSFAKKVAIFEQSKHVYDKPGAQLEKKGLRKSNDYSSFEFDAEVDPVKTSGARTPPPVLNGRTLSEFSMVNPRMAENVVKKVTMIREQGTVEEICVISCSTEMDKQIFDARSHGDVHADDDVDFKVSSAQDQRDVNNENICNVENVVLFENSVNVLVDDFPDKEGKKIENGDLENGVGRHPSLLSIPSIEITYVEDVDQTADPEFVPLHIGERNTEMANGDTSGGVASWTDDWDTTMEVEVSRSNDVEDEVIQEMNSRSQDQKVKGQKDNVTFVFPPIFHEGADIDLEMGDEGQGRDRTFSKDSVGTMTTVSSLSSSASSGGFEDYMLENLASEKQTIGDVVKSGRAWSDVERGTGDQNEPIPSKINDLQVSSENEDQNESTKAISPKKKKKHKKRDRKKKESVDDGEMKVQKRGLKSTEDVSVTIATTNHAPMKPPRATRPDSIEIGMDQHLLMRTPPGGSDDDDVLIVLTGESSASFDRRDQKVVLEALVVRDRSNSVKVRQAFHLVLT
jgi:hypothetical protein